MTRAQEERIRALERRRLVRAMRKHFRYLTGRAWKGPDSPLTWEKGWESGFCGAISLVFGSTSDPVEQRRRARGARRFVERAMIRDQAESS